MDLYGCSKIIFWSSTAVFDLSSNTILKEENNLSMRIFNILEIYGNHWSTKDGKYILDFIHLMDLAEAHLQSFLHMQNAQS
tara:strand:+ start:194 stop:436 length:243 start_codon:yes stop_codon:yes gene_type:complete